MRAVLRDELTSVLGVDPERIDDAASFHTQGLDSMGAITLVRRLSERLGRRLSPTLVWRYPTVRALATELAGVPIESVVAGGVPDGSPRPAASPSEPIAVVGMACRLPGASTLEELWAMLRDGRAAIREVPPDRWDAAAICARAPDDPRMMSLRWGGLLDRVDGFDPHFFGISPREAIQMDPQQRLMLELSWEALEDAGVPPGPVRPAGVFFGVVFNDYERLQGAYGLGAITQHTSTGSVHGIVANRVSYALGLQGPSLTVNTACSSSLVAVHLAIQSLRAGECALALAGGVHLMLAPETTLAVARFGALSPDGRCFTFDARANGYVRGEGGGVVVLKPLSAALRDGDRIYAVLLGSAVNNDGPSNGLTAPSPAAQEAVLREAYARACVDPATVDYVELHGTGTALGDPIEATALGAVAGAGRPAGRPLLVGSIKTNIGHLEAAAGVAGLIKVATSMYRGRLPPSLNFSRPNPEIDLEALRLRVITAAQPWPDGAGRPARAGVSSFGFGGTNAHLVLEEAPRAARLFGLAAESEEQLARVAGQTRAWIAQEPEQPLEAIGAGLAASRGPCRAALLASSREALAEALEGLASGSEGPGVMLGRAGPDPVRPVFVFSGLGCQWIGMGRRLFAGAPAFRAALSACDAALREEAGWSLIDALWAAHPERPLDDPDAHKVLNPLLVALQVATAALWRSWGITPAAVIGHSIGEVAAAHVAGALDLHEAMRVVARIGETYEQAVLDGGGLLGLVGLAPSAVEELLRLQASQVAMAGSNDPSSTLVCGPEQEARGMLRSLELRGVFCRELSRVWAHCPGVAKLAARLPEQLRGLTPRALRVPMISTTLGRAADGPELGAEHWRANVEQPVLFARGIDLLLREGYRCFLEQSPHAILLKSIEQCAGAAGAAVVALPSQLAERDGHETAFQSLGRLSTMGAEVRWESLFPWPSQAASAPGGELGAPFLLPLSARSEQSLRALAEHTRSALAEGPHATRDVCFTAALRRAHHTRRVAVAGRTRTELQERLEALARGETPSVVAVENPRVAFVFPGQGSQWVGMGRELWAEEPAFREALARCDRAIQAEAGFCVVDELHADERGSRLDQVEVIQPCIFAMQVALAVLWRSWNVEPAAVLGHSMGELAAACTAGALSLEDAVRVICVRSRIAKGARGRGAMAMVELPSTKARAAIAGLESLLDVAAENGPEATVLSGDPESLQRVLDRLQAQGVFCRLIKVDYASHSPQMEPLRGALLDALAGIRPGVAAVPILSTVTGGWVEGPELDAAYWGRNLRQTVRFFPAVQVLLAGGYDVLLEISPHPVLAPSLEQSVRHEEASARVVTSLRRDHGERLSLLDGLGRLYAAGLPIDFGRLHRAGGRVVSLPSYPWERQQCWVDETPASTPARPAKAQAGGAHPLLGAPFSSSIHAGVRFWEAEIDPRAPAYLADHQIQGTVVLPGTAYLEMALAAARDALGEGPWRLEDMSFEQPMMFPEGRRLSVQTVLSELGTGVAGIRISSRPGDGAEGWTPHAAGTLRRAAAAVAVPQPVAVEPILRRCGLEVPAEVHYARMARAGLDYGPAFRGAQHIHVGQGEALGRLRLETAQGLTTGAYVAHPALLDAAFQVLLAAAPEQDGPCVPTRVRSLQLYGRPDAGAWAHAVRRSDGAGDELAGDVLLLDEQGQLMAEARGVVLQRLERPSDRGLPTGVKGWLYGMQWLPAKRRELPRRVVRSWGVLADAGGLGQELRAALEALGDRCITLCPGQGYRSLGGGRYEVQPSCSEDLRRALLEATTEAGEPPWGLVHLWTQDAAPPEQTTIASLRRAEELGCGSVLALLRALADAELAEPPRLWLVTCGAQHVYDATRPVAIAQAPLLGLGRVITYEQPELRCVLLDLDLGAGAPRRVEALVAELCADSPEECVALRGDERFIARLSPLAVEDAAGEPWPSEPAISRAEPFRVDTSRPGSLDGLTVRRAERRLPGPGEVEIAIRATGLNFMNVMSALGIYPGYPRGVGPLGIECAGSIAAVGDGVQGLAPGDEVVAIAPDSLGSHAIANAHLVLPRPPRLEPEQAAALPVAFLTAHYGLCHLARLRHGERVLIHAAAGGVGLAAVQIAQRAGAEVFATGGTPEKQAYLRSIGVQHIFSSRSPDFAGAILERTGGVGVDVVLNSLSGELLRAGLSVLAPYGRFVELGKRDIYEGRPLGLEPFRRGLSFFAVDLERMIRERPAVLGEQLRELWPPLLDGSLGPLPHRTFPLSEVKRAFRRMGQPEHIGKVVISVETERAGESAGRGEALLRGDAAYLITGGLGALGLETARWMVEHGARHLMLVGRSLPSPEAARALDALARSGAAVRVSSTDVADGEQMARLIAEVRRDMPPLRGVVHAAGLLQDATLVRIDEARLRAVMAPKMDGAWNLHALTERAPLDFFVLYSSSASLLGSPGQGNYAAANAFLDALAHYRRAQGLPALCINWGPWSEVGLAARPDRGTRLAHRGLGSISPAQGIEALEWLLRAGTVQAGVLPLDVPQWCQAHPSVAGTALLAGLLRERDGAGASDRAGTFRDSLAAAEPRRQRRAMLEAHLKAQLAQVLMRATATIDARAPLRGLGLDSLMALELRNRLEVSLKLKLPVTVLWNYPTVHALATHLAQRMQIPLDAPDEVALEAAERDAPPQAGLEAAPSSPAQGSEKLVQLFAELKKASPEQLRGMLEAREKPPRS